MYQVQVKMKGRGGVRSWLSVVTPRGWKTEPEPSAGLVFGKRRGARLAARRVRELLRHAGATEIVVRVVKVAWERKKQTRRY